MFYADLDGSWGVSEEHILKLREIDDPIVRAIESSSELAKREVRNFVQTRLAQVRTQAQAKVEVGSITPEGSSDVRS